MQGRILALVLLWLAGLSGAHAHLMVAQRGTLNVVNDGAFMVLSIPVSALVGADSDGDGKLSMAELKGNRDKVMATIEANVKLLGEHGPRPLEGLMLTLSPTDEAPDAPAAQLVVMGRFALAETPEPLRFQVGLFGKNADEKSFQITATRSASKQLLVLNADRPTRALFPSAWAVFADYVVLGAEHIITGLDHLLFLLVVLSVSLGWRQVIGVLTAFTVGHATTLAASVWGGLSVPAALVEPAIAATIVGMAAFDIYTRRRGTASPALLTFALVFGCALVHGLGLASTLTELGLDSQHQLQSLAGFNVGVELGQLAVAVGAVIAAACIKRLCGEGGMALARRLASLAAMVVGFIWLLLRTIMPT